MEQLQFSIPQQEIWAEWLTWTESEHLNIGGYSLLSGRLDLKLMQQALDLLISKHACLRLIPRKEGHQILLDEFTCTLEYRDFSNHDEPVKKIHDWQHQWMQKPFSNPDEPPIRYALLRADKNSCYMVIQSLHTNMDGWSLPLTTEKWGDCYNYLLNQRDDESQLDTDKYLQFVEESNAYIDSKQYQKDHEYWQNTFPALPTPVFQKRYVTLEEEQERLATAYISQQHVNSDLRNKILEYCKQHNVTPFQYYLALLTVYLCRTQRLDEIVIGVPSLNRSGNKYKSTIGMFITVLPLTIKYDKSSDFLTLIKDIGRSLKQNYRHAKYPLSHHAKRLEVVRAGRDRLFDVIFSYEEFSFETYYGEAKLNETKQTIAELSRYPLALSLCDFEGSKDTEIVIESHSGYFSQDEGVLIGARLIALAKQLISTGVAPGDAQLATAAEHRVIAKLNRSQLSLPNIENFSQSILHNALVAPQSVALITKSQSFTYYQLCIAAIGLKSKLESLNVKPNDKVLLLLHRGPEVVISMLACNLMGAVFVPLDVEWPTTRIQSIISQSSAPVTLINKSFFRTSELSTHNIVLDTEELLQKCDVNFANQQLAVLEQTKQKLWPTAYLLFTSGTTGEPKGVQVSQVALNSRLNWIIEHWGLTSDDRSLQATQINFDPALIELLSPLIVGGSVAFPEPGRLLPETLPSIINHFNATMMAFVPATLTRFIDGIEDNLDSSLRVCCCGGEVLATDIATRFIKATNARLYNVYGPTEATIFCTAWQVHMQREKTTNMPLGKAISDTQVMILDPEKNILPFGVVGEIVIAGNCLANGYINNIQETQAKFKDIALLDADPITGYFTGDLGWLDTDGVLHFIGRADRQVKLRGYRIELPEIENALLRIDGVNQSAAKLVNHKGRQAIHAWYACTDNNVAHVRSMLAKQLPDYMLPSKLMAQGSLPLTNNGKIDFNQLPDIVDVQDTAMVRPPIGKLERLILEVWRTTLKSNEINVNTHFFDAGGDSLAAVIMLNELELQIKQKLSLYQLVANPTVVQLAEAINLHLNLPKLMISLGDTTRNASLYIAASGHGDMLRFKALAKSLRGVADLHMLQPPGNVDQLSTTELASLYAEKIAARGDKSIYVAGFSVGGLAALETAKNLELRGTKVQTLFIVDTILLKIPTPVLFIWRKLSKWLTRWHVAGQREAGSRLLSALLDQGLLLQVGAMNDYRISTYKGDSILIKSTAYRFVHRLLLGRWKKYLVGQFSEMQIATSHSRFFEPGKVDQLADLMREEINRKEGQRLKTADKDKMESKLN